MQPNSKGSTVLKKLPIWHTIPLMINLPQQLSQSLSMILNNNSSYILGQSSCQYSHSIFIYQIYIDQHYQVFAVKPTKHNNHHTLQNSGNRHNNRKYSDSQYCNSNNSSMNSSTVSQRKISDSYKIYSEQYNNNNEQEQETGDLFTIVHDIANTRTILVEIHVLAWIEYHGQYIIVWINQCKRCQVLRVNKQSIWHFLTSVQKSGMHTQNKHNELSPLNKRNPCINIHHKSMYFVGCEPIFHWELTSPVWLYSLQQEVWKENLNYDINQRKSSKFNNMGSIKQDRKVANYWMIMIGQVIVYIGSSYIRAAKLDQPNKIQILKLSDEKSPLVNPEQDTFISCTMSTPVVHRLILTKPNDTSRQPILFCMSVSTSSFHHTAITQLKSYHNHSMQQARTSHSTNSENNFSKSIKISSELYLHVWRYDIGIFLHHSANNNRFTEQTRCKNIYEIIKQIEYMQITQSVSVTQHPNHTASLSIFSRKSEDNKKSAPSSTKTYILNLYSSYNRSQTESSSTCIEISHYSIPLNQLEVIDFGRRSKVLIQYFQKKQYCDLLFLAQKRQIVCNRELFQFYSSKFKKLYSSSQNQNKSQSAQSQIMVKLDHTKFATIYFLVQHLYQGFSSPIKGLQEDLLIDLMILAQKFQISELQRLCEQQIQFNSGNFSNLYDYFRNSETAQFRQNLLKFFIIHAQQLIKLMPIGKVEQLIRLVYCPECSHTNIIQVKGQLENTYSIKDTQTGQNKQVNKLINYGNIIKGGGVNIKVCVKCNKLMGFGLDNHRKNKSTVRGSSVSARSKKKDNNSN